MAFNGSHAIFLSLALLLTVMATTPYVAKGAISVAPAALRIMGNTYCTPTGNPSPIGISPPLVNATVFITCANITGVTVRTDVNGFFNATIVTLPGVNLNLNLSISALTTECKVAIQLPVRTCLILPSRGRLRGVLVATGLLDDNELVGNVLSGVVLILRLLAFSFSG